MVDFKQALAARQSSFDALVESVSKLKEKAPQIVYEGDDPRFWTLKRDKSGNGSAIIRFLPCKEVGKEPYVRLFKHEFKGPTGSWYIENCLSTIGKKDPVMEMNSELWNSGSEVAKEQARRQKRKLRIYSVIYVVKDPAAPENEGKVFFYRYGQKIFDMINDQMFPVDDELESEPKKPINPFDLIDGCNFKLVCRTEEGKFPNYDKSKFSDPAPLFVTKKGEPDLEKIEEVWNQIYSLDEIVSEDKFKTVEQLKTRLNRVLGNGAVVEEDAPFDSDVNDNSVVTESSEEDDEAMKLFKKLADGN